MKAKSRAKSRILEAVHETAGDLHRLGFIDKRKMRKFDALCLDPIPQYDGQKIRALRDHLQVSQAVLAAVLNTSLSTVRKWEIGDKHPSGPSLKLLNLLDRKGLEAVISSGTRCLLHRQHRNMSGLAGVGARPDHDLNVLVQCGEKLHQAFDGELIKAVVFQG